MPLDINDFKGAIGSPARSFIFDVHIPRISSAVYRAQTAQIPSEASTDIDLFYQGHLVKFHGQVEYEHLWTATFVESETGEFIRDLSRWREQIYNPDTGRSGIPSRYKDIITIKVLRSDNGSPWLTGKLYGAYPKSIDALDLDRSANTETVKWSVQFNFDTWKRD